MWVVPVGWLLLLAAPGATAAPADRALPEPVYYRQPLLAIPFRLERPEPKAADPVAVQLQVSTDRGHSWHVASKVPANRGRFQFRADRDGEYWFVVQTVDAQGHLRPSEPGVPGLRVVVDTTAPQLDLDARRGPHGEVSVRWQITEANLDPQSVRILYRTDAASTLQSVVLDRRLLEAPQATRVGDVSWRLPAGASRAEIRAEARDLAGNVVVSHAQVDLQAAAVAQGAPATPSPAPPANRPPSGAAVPRALPKTGGESVAQWRGASDDPAPLPWQHPATPRPSSRPPKPTAKPAAQPAIAPSEEAEPLVGPQLGNGRTTLRAPVPSAPGPVPEASVAIPIHPALGNQYTPSASQDEAEAAPSAGQPRPRMVNSRVFELDYAVDSVGPSGIARVELWGTRDSGHTWKSYGVDEDKRSPFLVHLDDEGLYGFCVAIRSGAGLGGEPPSGGSTPDLWIEVDRTPAEVRILSAEQVPGKPAGEILVRWEAHDRAMALQAVSLLYSATPGGPWTPLAANLENSGQYTWSVDPGVPGQVYLRIEARDAAGNLGSFELPQPIAVDCQRPSGHIRDIRPVEASAKAPVTGTH